MATDPALVALRSALADILLAEGYRIGSYLQSRLLKYDMDDLYQDVDDALDAYDDTDFEDALQSPAIQVPLQQAYAHGFLGALAHVIRWTAAATPLLSYVTQVRQAPQPMALPAKAPAPLAGTPPTAEMQIVWGLQNQLARQYAQQRAAELVGKRRTANGLVDNPQTKWQIDDATRDGIKKLVIDAFTEHPSYRDIKARLEAMPGWNTLFGEYRAEMIARTELALAASAGSVESATAHGVTHMRCSDGCKFDRECCDLNSTIQTVAYAKAHLIGHPNCCLGSTPVLSFGVRCGFSRYYEGDIVIIDTAGQRHIAVTPNHPILTTQGWVAANGLRQGDNVISITQDRWQALRGLLGEKAKDIQIASIADVAHAIQASGLELMRVSREDFHGDGANSQVCVVGTDSALLNHGDAPLAQGIDQRNFTISNMQSFLLSRNGTEHASIQRVDLPTSGDVCGIGETGILQAYQRINVCTATQDNAAVAQTISDDRITDTNAICDALGTFATLVSTDQIVHIERNYFSGHVYNLETLDGWYLADTIVTHNCVRVWTPVAAQKDADGSQGPGISTGLGLSGYELDSTPKCLASCPACRDSDHCVGGKECTCHQ